MLAPSGDRIGWAELTSALREINIAAENNVCCIFGVCFGMYLSTALSVTEPTPYFLTIAPEREVSVGELKRASRHSMSGFSKPGTLRRPIRSGWWRCSASSGAREIFGKVFATYIVNHGSGAAISARRENLITKLLRRRGISDATPEQLRNVRAQMKAGLKLSQDILDRYASIFLIGRKAIA